MAAAVIPGALLGEPTLRGPAAEGVLEGFHEVRATLACGGVSMLNDGKSGIRSNEHLERVD